MRCHEKGARMRTRVRRWTPEQDALLGTDTDDAIGALLVRTRRPVEYRRQVLGVKAFVGNKPAKPVDWTHAKDRLVGTMGDDELAQHLGCTARQVRWRRQ